jgi:pimeloyl-[acyl-carrier protein] methyl ester esterase
VKGTLKQSLVLIHGWGFNGAVWDGLLPLLQPHFELFVVDLPGYRQRPLLDAMTLSALAQDVASQVPEQAIWLGWSLGGQVALQAAIEQPQRIGKLLLVGATPRFVAGGEWRSAIKQRILDDFGSELIRSRETTIGRFITLQMLGVKGGRERVQVLKQALSEAPQPGTLEAGLQILNQTDLRARLSQIEQPTLWLMGERDQLVPASAGEAAAAVMPQGRVVTLKGCGHAPFLSHAEAFVEAVVGFAG